MKNIMIDLETMGTGSNAAICSIGAVEFDLESGTLGREFYETVDLQSSVNAGGAMDAATVLWWLKQSEAASKELLDPSTDIYVALTLLTDWMCDSETPLKEIRIWGNGADFDNVILINAYERLGMVAPWGRRSNRCYRTIKSMNGDLVIERAGIHHNALDDAKSQAQHLIKLMQHTIILQECSDCGDHFGRTITDDRSACRACTNNPHL